MTEDVGKLVLRLTLGLLMLLHGIAKIRTGIGGIEGMLEANGLPAFIALGVYVGEVVAPLLLILGFHARTGSALIVVNMLFAIGLAHLGDVASLNRTGGWGIELQAFYLFTAVAVLLLGPGRYAINRR
ncbi:MAG: DoxX family protein [bacterium]|jgi:putative oxidoreductase|nr:DoxX family protein [Betaproteobacteria bacterium]